MIHFMLYMYTNTAERVKWKNFTFQSKLCQKQPPVGLWSFSYGLLWHRKMVVEKGEFHPKPLFLLFLGEVCLNVASAYSSLWKSFHTMSTRKVSRRCATACEWSISAFEWKSFGKLCTCKASHQCELSGVVCSSSGLWGFYHTANIGNCLISGVVTITF